LKYLLLISKGLVLKIGELKRKTGNNFEAAWRMFQVEQGLGAGQRGTSIPKFLLKQSKRRFDRRRKKRRWTSASSKRTGEAGEIELFQFKTVADTVDNAANLEMAFSAKKRSGWRWAMCWAW
jgi:hypothetical protein